MSEGLTPRLGPRAPDLYAALLHRQSPAVQADASVEEVYWRGSSTGEGRPASVARGSGLGAVLQRHDDELVARIHRRVRGGKINLPTWRGLFGRHGAPGGDGAGRPSSAGSAASAPAAGGRCSDVGSVASIASAAAADSLHAACRPHALSKRATMPALRPRPGTAPGSPGPPEAALTPRTMHHLSQSGDDNGRIASLEGRSPLVPSGSGTAQSWTPRLDSVLPLQPWPASQAHKPFHALLRPTPAACQHSRSSCPGLGLAQALQPEQRACAQGWLGRSRAAAAALVGHPDFNGAVLLLILASCLVLGLQRPLEAEGSPWNAALGRAGLALNVAFAVELLLRCWAAGSLLEYLRGPWNLLDAIVVAAGFASLAPGASGSGATVLRALRALRPLRAVSQVQSLRVVVVCLLEAAQLLASVGGLLAFLLLLFAVAGTQLFMDDFYQRCVGATGQAEPLPAGAELEEFGCGWRACPANYTCVALSHRSDPLVAPGFGNLGLSALSVFQVITTTDWSLLLYRTMDASSPAALLYYVLLVFLGAFFVVNLFVAVLYSKFTRARRLYSQAQQQLEQQQEQGPTGAGAPCSCLPRLWRWLAWRLRPLARAQTWQRGRVRPAEGPAPQETPSWRQPLTRLCSSPWFGYFFLACVVGNIAAMCAYRAGMSEVQQARLEVASMVFTCLFVAEAALKLAALGLRYFADGWNCFDAAIVLISVADVAMTVLTRRSGSLGFFSVLRALRVLRVLRLLKSIRYLAPVRRLCGVLLHSMASMAAIAGLLLAFMLAWALLGLSLFGPRLLDPPYPNFNSFFNSLVVVFQVLTLEGYDSLLASTAAASSWGAPLYFLAWIIVGRWTLVTLFLAVSLSSFQECFEPRPGSLGVGSPDAGSALPSKTTSTDASPADVPPDSPDAIAAFWAAPGPLGTAPADTLAEDLHRAEAPGLQTAECSGVRHCSTKKSVSFSLLADATAAIALGGQQQPQQQQQAALPAVVEEWPAVPVAVAAATSATGAQNAGGSAAGQPQPGPSEPFSEPPVRVHISHFSADAHQPVPFPSTKTPAPPPLPPAPRAAPPPASASPARVPNSPPAASSPGASLLAASLFSVSATLSQAPAQQRAAAAAESGDPLCWASLYSAPAATSSALMPAQDEEAAANTGAAMDGGVAASCTAGQSERRLPQEQPEAGAAGRAVEPSSCNSSRVPSEVAAAAAGLGGSSQEPLQESLQPQGVAGPGQLREGTGCPSLGSEAAPPGAAALPEPAPDAVAEAGCIGEAAATPVAAAAAYKLVSAAAAACHGPQPLDAAGAAAAAQAQQGARADQREDGRSIRTACTEESGATAATGTSNWSGRTSASRLTAYLLKKGGREYPPLEGTALFLFKVDSPWRGRLYRLVTAQAVEYIMMVLVLASCVQMALEAPAMNAGKAAVLAAVDAALTAAFGLECLLKLAAFGFRSYWRFNSNKLDLVIVAVSVVVLATSSSSVKLFKALRVLRALKPLRMLARSSSMLLVLRSLALSVVAMGHVTLLVLLFFLIMAILGVQLFAGELWGCSDPAVAAQADCIGTFEDPALGPTPRVWSNSPLNFDNTGEALLTLFVASTMDGFTGVMATAMGVRAPSGGALTSHTANPAAFLFFLVFLTAGGFLMTNLYTGVLFDQFSRIKQRAGGCSAVLTPAQQEFVHMVRAVFRLRPAEVPPPPRAWPRAACFRLVQSPWFEPLMLGLVCANVALMAAQYYGQPAAAARGVEAGITAVSVCIILEAAAKLGALGPRCYWRCSHWNKFDGLLALACLADVVLQVASLLSGRAVSLPAIKKLLALVRTLRMARLIRFSRGMQALLTTLVTSLPAFWNVGALLLLALFVYAYMGMMLFGSLAWGDSINEHANFSNFLVAYLTLFRLSTGDNWSGVMLGCMVAPPDCDPTAGTCGTWAAVPYFVSFSLLVPMVLLELFKAVIIDNFEGEQEAAEWKLAPVDLEDFCQEWARLDDGSGGIRPEDLEILLLRLRPPLGLGPGSNGKEILRFVYDLDIPLVGGRCPFHKTALELVRRCSAVPIPEGHLQKHLARIMQRLGPAGSQDDNAQMRTALAALRIQRWWRSYHARRLAQHWHASVEHSPEGSCSMPPLAAGALRVTPGTTA